MTNFEMVETLREKANVSYEEAKDALEQSNWDLLDAMLLLEKAGKVNPGSARYSTKPEEEAEAPEGGRKRRDGGEGARGALKWLGQSFCKLLRIGNANAFVVSRRGEELFSLPVTVFVVLMIFGFWFMFAALAVGLFCGARYSFRGPNLGKPSINEAMDRAAEAAETVKKEFRAHSEAVEHREQENDGDGANE